MFEFFIGSKILNEIFDSFRMIHIYMYYFSLWSHNRCHEMLKVPIGNNLLTFMGNERIYHVLNVFVFILVYRYAYACSTCKYDVICCKIYWFFKLISLMLNCYKWHCITWNCFYTMYTNFQYNLITIIVNSGKDRFQWCV